jgi:hypothetical protein
VKPVVNAVLRDGIRHVISPLIGDQFFWTKLVATQNVGVAVDGVLTSMTTDGMRVAIQAASDTSIQAEVAGLGEAVQEERCGVERRASILVGILAKSSLNGVFL